MDAKVSATESKKRSPLPFLFAALSLLLLILLLGFYFGKCVGGATPAANEKVLGVSSINTSASKNPVVNGESFTFSTTAVADANGMINATIKFDLSGQGVIDNNIHGPGNCLKLSDATAVCNTVNAQANETLTWSVPVTPSANCIQSSPSSLSFQAQLITLVGTLTSTTGVNCVASQTGNNPTPTSTSNQTVTPTSTGSTGTAPGGGQTSTQQNQGQTGNQGTNNGSGGSLPAGSGITTNGQGGAKTAFQGMKFADFACYRIGDSFPLVFLLLILWLIAVASYMIYNHTRKKGE